MAQTMAIPQIINPEDNPAVKMVLAEIEGIETRCPKQVRTAEDYATAGELLRQVKGAAGRWEAQRVSFTGPLNDIVKRFNALFKRPAERLSAVERALKGAMVTYQNEIERQRREAQAKLDREAAAQRAKLEARALKAQEAGKEGKADLLRTQAEAVVAPIIAAPVAQASGTSTREVWCFEVTNEELVPREYCSSDQKKIRGVVNALHDKANIPGVRIWRENRIAASAAG